MLASPLRVVGACVAKPSADPSAAVRAAAVVVDGSDGKLLARAVAFLTPEEASLAPRPDELVLRGAMAALPAVARGILEALVVATSDAAVARRIGQDLGIPTVAVGGPEPLPGWGVDPSETQPVAEAGRGAMSRALDMVR